MTDVERVLWGELRDRRMNGTQFRRQHPVGQYIVDFACIEQMLVIELDGGQHQEQLAYDNQRTNYLKLQGWNVLRFWNNEVFENIEAVLTSIAANMKTYPHPSPPPEKGRGQKISLKARALRYLSAREHSRHELAQKLARYASEEEDIEALLNWLEAANFLSEERFSESMLNRRVARFGNSRIMRELQSHGIEGDTLADIKTKLEQDESARAIEVWRRKFGHKSADASERAKQMRFLLQRGFSHRAIQAAMRAETDNES